MRLTLPDLPEARCVDADPELFHDEDRYDEARVVWCAPCPEREACLAWALDRSEAGLWGGTSAYERSLLLVRRVSTLPVANRRTAQAR